MFLRHFWLLGCCLIATFCAAQRSISGTLTNASDGEPLAYVHVFLIAQQQHGVISNERGEYSIELAADQLTDQLVFSLLGFQTHFEPVEKIGGDLFNLKMNRSFIALDEIVVTSDLGLRNIVRRALRKIPENYGHDKYFLRAYYREFALSDGEYSKFTEAMITIPDENYDHLPNPEKGWLDHFRQSDNFRHKTFRNGVVQAILKEPINRQLWNYGFNNPMRNNRIHRRPSPGNDGLDEMHFSNRGEYLENGDTLVRIEFNAGQYVNPDDGLPLDPPQYMYQGELLINRSDDAILRYTIRHEDVFLRDLVFEKYRGKYYPRRLQTMNEFSHGEKEESLGEGRRKHRENILFYFYDILTEKEEMKAYKKGKLFRKDQPIEDWKFKYEPEFWATNQLLIRLPAPDLLATELNQEKSLEQQYRDNASSVKE